MANNKQYEVSLHKNKAMKTYDLSSEYESMVLVKNLSVLSEYATLLSEQLSGSLLVAGINLTDLDIAINNVTTNLDLSNDSWTVKAAITRDIGIDKSTTSDGLTALDEYLVLLRISLEKALAAITGDPIPNDKGLFDKLRELALPKEKDYFTKDIVRITDMYIPGYKEWASQIKPAASAPQPIQETVPSAYTVGQQIRFISKSDILSGTITAIEPMVSGKDYKLTIDVAELGQTKKYSENNLKVIS